MCDPDPRYSQHASFGCLALIRSPCLDENTAGVLILTFLPLTSLRYLPEKHRRTEGAVDTGGNHLSRPVNTISFYPFVVFFFLEMSPLDYKVLPLPMKIS